MEPGIVYPVSGFYHRLTGMDEAINSVEWVEVEWLNPHNYISHHQILSGSDIDNACRSNRF